MMRWVGAGVAEMTVALRLDRNQTIPSALGELRVRLEHVDGEGDLIDHALPGTVTAGEQFEVTEGVIAPVSIDVVDSFVARQFAPQVLFHDEPVLEDGFLATGDTGRNGDTPVPVTRFVAREYPTVFNRVFEASSSRCPLVFRFASLITELLLTVVDCATSSDVSRHRLGLPAMKTREVAFRFGFLVTPRIGTSTRTVLRVFPVKFSIRSHSSWFHGESLSTACAMERDRIDNGSDTTMGRFVGPNAILRTELSVLFARFVRERFFTVLTRFQNRHDTLLVGYEGSVAGSVT